MADQPASRLEGMRAALYFLALLLIGVPLLDWGRGIFPAAIGESTWRFAVTQLLSNFLVTPAVGLAIAVGTARVTEDWRTLAGLRYLLWLLCILFGTLTILFPFDALQARLTLRPTARAVFNIGMASGILHLVLMLVYVLVLTRAANLMMRGAPRLADGKASPRQKLVERA